MTELTRVPKVKSKYGSRAILKPSQVDGRTYLWDFTKSLQISFLAAAYRGNKSKVEIQFIAQALEQAEKEAPNLLSGPIDLMSKASGFTSEAKARIEGAAKTISPFKESFLDTWPSDIPRPIVNLSINYTSSGCFGEIKITRGDLYDAKKLEDKNWLFPFTNHISIQFPLRKISLDKVQKEEIIIQEIFPIGMMSQTLKRGL